MCCHGPQVLHGSKAPVMCVYIQKIVGEIFCFQKRYEENGDRRANLGEGSTYFTRSGNRGRVRRVSVDFSVPPGPWNRRRNRSPGPCVAAHPALAADEPDRTRFTRRENSQQPAGGGRRGWPSATAGNRLPAVRADRWIPRRRRYRLYDTRDRRAFRGPGRQTAAVQTFPGTAHACRGRHSRATYGRAHTQSPGPVSAACNIRHICMSVCVCVCFIRARVLYLNRQPYSLVPQPSSFGPRSQPTYARHTCVLNDDDDDRLEVYYNNRRLAVTRGGDQFGFRTKEKPYRGLKITAPLRIRSGSVSGRPDKTQRLPCPCPL